MLPFVFDGRKIAQGRVAAWGIVEAFDELKDGDIRVAGAGLPPSAQRRSAPEHAKIEDLDPTSSRAVAEYLSVLDDAAFGGATPVEPKAISPTDPAACYTASANAVAGYAYSDNYLIDLKHAVIMDVEATTAIHQAEVGAAKTMLDRTNFLRARRLLHAKAPRRFQDPHDVEGEPPDWKPAHSQDQMSVAAQKHRKEP
jgi:hypothetical protein